jgi:hypothetical protein
MWNCAQRFHHGETLSFSPKGFMQKVKFCWCGAVFNVHETLMKPHWDWPNHFIPMCLHFLDVRKRLPHYKFNCAEHSTVNARKYCTRNNIMLPEEGFHQPSVSAWFIIEKICFSSLKYCKSVIFILHVLFGANQSLNNLYWCIYHP